MPRESLHRPYQATHHATQNEEQVRAAVAESGVPPGDVFVTSKVSPYQQGTERALAACEHSLSLLAASGGAAGEDGGTIGCMLVHWPGVAKTDASSPANAQLRLQTWRVLEQFYRQGRFRSIGVSNYTAAHLQELWDVAEVKPHVNQVCVCVGVCTWRQARVGVEWFTHLHAPSLFKHPP